MELIEFDKLHLEVSRGNGNGKLQQGTARDDRHSGAALVGFEKLLSGLLVQPPGQVGGLDGLRFRSHPEQLAAGDRPVGIEVDDGSHVPHPASSEKDITSPKQETRTHLGKIQPHPVFGLHGPALLEAPNLEHNQVTPGILFYPGPEGISGPDLGEILEESEMRVSLQFAVGGIPSQDLRS